MGGMQPRQAGFMPPRGGIHHWCPWTPEHQQRANDKVDIRKAAAKGVVKFQSILKMSNMKIVKFLRAGGRLSTIISCPVRNCKGHRSKLQPSRGGGAMSLRCSACKRWVSPHSLSPVFISTARGTKSVPLHKQAGILHCAAWGVPQALLPALMEHVSHKTVESIYHAWRALLSDYVKAK